MLKVVWNEKKDVAILPVWEGEKPELLEEDFWKYLTEKEIFTGKKDQMLADLGFYGKDILLIGFCKKEDLVLEDIRKGLFKAAKELGKNKVKEAYMEMKFFKDVGENALKAVLEGLLQSTYVFDTYKGKKEDRPELEVSLFCEHPKKEEILVEMDLLMQSIFFTRDLINEPAIVMTPTEFSRRAKKALEEVDVKVEIYDRDEIEKIGMTAFLAVAKGSDQEPKFMVMKYLPQGEDVQPKVLVGKGLTYDSGGYSIKPTEGMASMNCDMSGAATVVGALLALAKNKVKKNVIAVTALCENMLSGRSYKPGDIVYSMSGKTIEIGNTDAEGRVTLADSLYYSASKLNPEYIIDLATLTGACVVALGNEYTGAVTNDEELFEAFQKASYAVGEKVWAFPADDVFREMVKGKRGDLLNSTGKSAAGTITAGMFLENFVEQVPWIHLDIAGVAYGSEAKGYLPKYATGVSVKALYHFIKEA